MNNMRNRMMGVKEKLVEKLGDTAERIGEQARGRCFIIGAYEPKLPIELLKEDQK